MNHSFLYAKPILFKHPDGWDEMSNEQQKKICQVAIINHKDFVYDIHIKIRKGADMKNLEKVCGIKTWLCDECGFDIKGTVMPKLGETTICDECIAEDKQ